MYLQVKYVIHYIFEEAYLNLKDFVTKRRFCIIGTSSQAGEKRDSMNILKDLETRNL